MRDRPYVHEYVGGGSSFRRMGVNLEASKQAICRANSSPVQKAHVKVVDLNTRYQCDEGSKFDSSLEDILLRHRSLRLLHGNETFHSTVRDAD
jgi:hypothetical protein